MTLLQTINLNFHYPIIFKNKNIRSQENNKIGANISYKNNKLDILALKNINLKILKGERLGIIGHNGSGKSTLLSILGGIYHPTSGEIIQNCSCKLLLDPMKCLSTEESGLINIKRIGLLQGLSLETINNNIDEIINLTDLGNYINMPIKTYSSGMKLRLCFAISLINTDVLLCDEFLSTGDKKFRDFLENKINDKINNMGAFLLGSHSIVLLSLLVDKIIVLENGSIIDEGPTSSIIKKYL